MAGLHGDFAFEEDVQVLIDDLVMGQNCIPIVEILFFLIHIPLEYLIQLLHLLPILVLHFKLRQVITDLFAIPAFGFLYLTNDVVSFADHVLKLLLGLFLASK